MGGEVGEDWLVSKSSEPTATVLLTIVSGEDLVGNDKCGTWYSGGREEDGYGAEEVDEPVMAERNSRNVPSFIISTKHSSLTGDHVSIH